MYIIAQIHFKASYKQFCKYLTFVDACPTLFTWQHYLPTFTFMSLYFAFMSQLLCFYFFHSKPDIIGADLLKPSL